MPCRIICARSASCRKVPLVARPAGVRAWATPLTISAFFLMAGTGVLMFFDYDRGLTAVVHQWCSWLFLACAVGHIVANVRPLKAHLLSRWGGTAFVILMMVFAASSFSWGLVTGPQLERPIERSLAEAPLASLAGIRRTSPDVLIGKLKAQGIAATPDQSLRDRAERQRVDINRLFGIVFDVGQ